MNDKTESSKQVLSLPKGGGAIKGIGETFQPNLFSGTGNFTIPIATSPGRAGFGPQLSLQYSTGNGNGPFGLGWQLSIPRITRKTEKGLPKYTNEDVFVMSGAEDLVPCLKEIEDPDTGKKTWISDDPITRGDYTITRYRPRTEGLFARIEKWVKTQGENLGDVHWRATTKDNVTSIYGRTPEARIADPDHPDHIYEWLLQETFDAKGNHMLYEYAKDDPDVDLRKIYEEHRTYCQRYIRRIYYGNLPNPLVDETGNPILYEDGSEIGHEREGTDHQDHLSLVKHRYALEVIFDYGDWDVPTQDPHPQAIPLEQQEVFGPNPANPLENNSVPVREDVFSSFRAGFEIRTLRRCRRVLMFHHFKELGGPTLVQSTDFEYEHNDDTRVSFLIQATVTGYRKTGNDYIQRSMPPVTFKYSEFKPYEQRYQSVTAEGNDLPSFALNNPDLAFVDLDGNGLPDILHTTSTGFRYWKNLGDGHFDRPHPMHHSPAGVALSQTGVSFADMAGDGRADLLVLNEPLQGFFETTPETTWETFKPIPAMPSLNLAEPNVRLLDLTGDGLTDALMTRDHHFLWFQCLGEQGYDEPQFVERVHDLDEFPDVYFNDSSGRVRLADMTGDGLNDIVLIHNGRVDYWPNLGYGDFGRRITMAESPRLEHNFDPARLFLVDLDGSGCADLVYVDVNEVHFWFNRSGNSWSEEQIIHGTPMVTNTAALQFTDFFGTGTTSLVWSYDYNQQPGSNYKVLDFCGGEKPYLLTEMSNNMGATTRVRYAPSTKYYLEDEANGEPWATKLPFPVQVVEKTEVIDHISKTKLVTTYTYHHGYFDGREREFRGFGRVDQIDTETFEVFSQADLHDASSKFDNTQQAFHVPPVLTKTWFHTGIYYEANTNGRPFDADRLLEKYRTEFYQGDTEAFEIGRNLVPNGDTPHEAFRALRGSILRTEIYALDQSEKHDQPYAVTDNIYEVIQVQAREDTPHAVYRVAPLNSLSYHYERDLHDPRISQQLTLETDEFGNVKRAAAIAYPRRDVVNKVQSLTNLSEDPSREAELRDLLIETQRGYLITYTENSYVEPVDEPDAYRHSVLCDTQVFELTNIPAPINSVYIRQELFDAFENASLINYEEPASNSREKRLVDQKQVLFWKDDLSGPLPLDQIGKRGLVYESYQLAFTPSLLQQIYGNKVNSSMLDTGGYVERSGERWIPSGTQGFNPQRFYLPVQQTDPFGNTTLISYDPYLFLPKQVIDPVGNEITVELNNYRVFQPQKIKDSNDTLSEVVFDALGMVVGAAIRDKNGEGDSLNGFITEPTDAQIADSFNHALDLLGNATTRLVYNLNNFQDNREPVFVHTIAREIHASEAGGQSADILQHTFLYSDGFGREVQTKIQAEPGEVNGNHVVSRWVGTGTTVYNNKGKPVQQYEPFFSATHAFGIEQHGVSPTLFYDPIERVIATIHPDHTYEKVVFNPWQQITWDANDTVLLRPQEDMDVKGMVNNFIQTYQHPLDNRPFKTWYDERIPDRQNKPDINGAQTRPEQRAALKTEAHAGTPTTVYFDTLGRLFLMIGDNRSEKLATIVTLDIEGNDLAIIDPRNITAFEHQFDIAGRKVNINSVDAGNKLVFPDVINQPLYTWDANQNETYRCYDELRRPIELWVKEKGTNEYFLAEKTIYGETKPGDPKATNHRGQIWKVYDGAGLAENIRFDFKGNLEEASRTLLKDGKKQVRWAYSSDPDTDVFDETEVQTQLDSNHIYTARTTYDALNRVTRNETPDGTVQEPLYNEANLLNALKVTKAGASAPELFVKNIDYNAKGQRTNIEYGNDMTTEYRYDPETFRLIRILTTRKGTQTPKELQDLKYTYDPVGNIIEIRDDAHRRIFYNNQAIDSVNHYTYDALYRLIESTGREHEAMSACHYQTQAKKQTEFFGLPQSINNAQALITYTETYHYDKSGNIEEIKHNNGHSGWTRSQTYENESNRIQRSQAGCQHESTTIAHDANGNILSLSHLPLMAWDFKNQLIEVQLNEGTNPNKAYYQYDGAGQRVRKTVVKNGKTEERIYLGGDEIYTDCNGSGITLKRDTIHIMDDKDRIALIEAEKNPANSQTINSRTRYQLSNHLGSATLEVDDSPDAKLISYEEYYPYGGTAYLAGQNATEAKHKRYRYSGKERDDETGLYYYGARYYAPWLGRWVNCDPIGPEDAHNLYQFVQSNPLMFNDKNGNQAHVPVKQNSLLEPPADWSEDWKAAYWAYAWLDYYNKEQGIPISPYKGMFTPEVQEYTGSCTAAATRHLLRRRLQYDFHEKGLRFLIDLAATGSGDPKTNWHKEANENNAITVLNVLFPEHIFFKAQTTPTEENLRKIFTKQGPTILIFPGHWVVLHGIETKKGKTIFKIDDSLNPSRNEWTWNDIKNFARGSMSWKGEFIGTGPKPKGKLERLLDNLRKPPVDLRLDDLRPREIPKETYPEITIEPVFD